MENNSSLIKQKIEELKQKIGDDTKGLTKKINDLDTKIASNSNAAHSENPSEQRQREAEGKQGEITAANEVKQQAIREGDSHDTAKKEALRDKRSAEEAVLDEEARIRKEISDRKTSLQDQITKNSWDATKATAITAWQDELDGKIWKVKDFTEYLTPPHTGSTLVAKKQAVTDAGNVLTDLVNKDIGVSRKIADAQNEVMRLGNEKTAILSRATWANVASLTTTDQAELARLKSEKSGLEDKIKEKKATIDTIATKLENKFSLNSRSGTKALAEAEFNRLQALVTPAPAGGVAWTLVSAKDTAKTARNLAFIDLNTAADTLNAEAARLGAGLDVKVPHISEFRKGQGYGDDLSMRENWVAWDKAADHKMKPAKSAIKTVLTRGH